MCLPPLNINDFRAGEHIGSPLPNDLNCGYR
jgi:hypothetical protein